MSADTELLRQYVEERSEAAFTALVREHVNLVYSAALREMNGDGAQAEEIVQVVFSQLAREGARLLRHPSLAGWLYTSVRHCAANLRRGEQRRRRREEEAMKALLSEDSPELAWQQLRPVLDDALHELKEADRVAVVLRFLEDRSLREVGEALGLQENAARMRVERALEKLRLLLARRGITSTAAGLVGALAVGVVTPAPTALAATITGAALAGATAASSTTLTWIQLMSMTHVKISVVGALVVAGIAVPAWQQTRLHRVQAENAQLRTQAATWQAQENELTTLRGQAAQLNKAETEHAELERLRQYEAQTQPELLRLRSMAGAARRASRETEQLRAQLAQPASATGTNPVPAAMAEAMRQSMELNVEGRLARMAASLHLSPEQTQTVREMLLEHAQLQRRVYTGEASAEEQAALGKSVTEMEQQLQALLTPEQRALFPNYKQEDAAYNARRSAGGELVQMAAALNLTQDQEDRAFAALYELSLTQFSGRNLAVTPTNQVEALQWYWDQKAKVLESVLTPEQLGKYRQQQAAQTKLARQIVGGGQEGEPAPPK